MKLSLLGKSCGAFCSHLTGFILLQAAAALITAGIFTPSHASWYILNRATASWEFESVGHTLVSNEVATAYAADNLLLNPSFEEREGEDEWNPLHWDLDGNVSREEWEPRSGDWSLMIQDWNSGTGYAHQSTSAVSGYEYTLSVWAVKEGAPEDDVPLYMEFEWLDGDAQVIDSVRKDILPPLREDDGGPGWSEFTLSSAAPAGTGYIRVKLGGENVEEAGYFDDILLTEKALIPGSVSLDSDNYYTLFSSAVITAIDIDSSLNPGAEDTVSVKVTSDTDDDGFNITLLETSSDTGVFTSTVPLRFSLEESLPSERVLKVRDGDTVTAEYTDASGGVRVSTAGFHNIDRRVGGIYVEENPPGESDYIRGRTRSVNASVSVYVYDIYGSTLAELTAVSDENGEFAIDLGDNRSFGMTPDPDTGHVSFYVGTRDTDPSGRILVRNDIKCVIREEKIRFESVPWGEGVDYLVGEEGAVESGAELLESVPGAGGQVRTMVKVEGETAAVEPDGSFRIAVGDRYRKHASVEALFIDPAYNTAGVEVRNTTRRNQLLQNAPNPFVISRDDFTVIRYEVESDTHVEIEIYNLAGELIKTLVDEFRPAGQHIARWYGDNGGVGDNTGRTVGSGVYVYVIEAGGFRESRKIIVVR